MLNKQDNVPIYDDIRSIHPTSFRNFSGELYIYKKGKCFNSTEEYKNQITYDDIFIGVDKYGHIIHLYMIMLSNGCRFKYVPFNAYQIIYGEQCNNKWTEAVKCENRTEQQDAIFSDHIYFAQYPNDSKLLFPERYIQDNTQSILQEYQHEQVTNVVRKKRKRHASRTKQQKKKKRRINPQDMLPINRILSIIYDHDLSSYNIASSIKTKPLYVSSEHSPLLWKIYMTIIKELLPSLYYRHEKKLNYEQYNDLNTNNENVDIESNNKSVQIESNNKSVQIESNNSSVEIDDLLSNGYNYQDITKQLLQVSYEETKEITMDYFNAYTITLLNYMNELTNEEYRQLFQGIMNEKTLLEYDYEELQKQETMIILAYNIYINAKERQKDREKLMDEWY